MERVRLSLDGLSLGDAFGERFFLPPGEAIARIVARRVPPPTWPYTDDTAMALAIAEVLDRCAEIDRDALARAFADRFVAEPDRGYGRGARSLLQAIARGVPWSLASPALFSGQGSKGNGGGMRAAPVGAYFADDPAAIVAQARASAEVTHAHAEGVAGAIAVALAAGWAAAHSGSRDGDALLEHVLRYTPRSRTREGIEAGAALDPALHPATAAERLGSGQQVLAEDTVPFAIWSAARHLGDLCEALWATVAGLGDRDTTCAMVGGVVALAVGRAGIPSAWLAAREPLPVLRLADGAAT